MEAALSIYLENFATTLGSREQLAIAEVADALLVIPKCLAVNAAKDATELVRPFVLPVDRACTFAEHASPGVWYCCWQSCLIMPVLVLGSCSTSLYELNLMCAGVKAESIPLHRSDETREGWVVQIWPGSHQGCTEE